MCIYKFSAVLETIGTFLTCAAIYCWASLNASFPWKTMFLVTYSPLWQKKKIGWLPLTEAQIDQMVSNHCCVNQRWRFVMSHTWKSLTTASFPVRVNAFAPGLICAWADQSGTSVHAGGGAAEMMLSDVQRLGGRWSWAGWQELGCWGLTMEIWASIGCSDLLCSTRAGLDNNKFINNNSISILPQSYLSVVSGAHGLHIDPIDVLFPVVGAILKLRNMVVLLNNSSGTISDCFPTFFKKKGEWELRILKNVT